MKLLLLAALNVNHLSPIAVAASDDRGAVTRFLVEVLLLEVGQIAKCDRFPKDAIAKLNQNFH